MTTSTRTVAQKMGVRAGDRAHLVAAPEGVVDGLGMPEVVWLATLPSTTAEVDHLHLFVTRADELRTRFAELRHHVAPAGRLWVSWPKGGRLGSDLTLPRVIEIGYDLGMVESTCLRVDETWAGLKFTHPKPGKAYANSYGRLPEAKG